MPADKRILNWDLSAWKLDPLIEAETVITLLYHMQTAAPQVWSDLITRTNSATTREDLMKTVAEWAGGWRLCGLTGVFAVAFAVAGWIIGRDPGRTRIRIWSGGVSWWKSFRA